MVWSFTPHSDRISLTHCFFLFSLLDIDEITTTAITRPKSHPLTHSSQAGQKKNLFYLSELSLLHEARPLPGNTTLQIPLGRISVLRRLRYTPRQLRLFNGEPHHPQQQLQRYRIQKTALLWIFTHLKSTTTTSTTTTTITFEPRHVDTIHPAKFTTIDPGGISTAWAWTQLIPVQQWERG